MVGKSKQETAIFRINDDGTISFVPTEEFKLAVQNIFVKKGTKPVPAEKFWRESPDRHERMLVFKPGDTAQPHEYNLWRGFGVEQRKGWQKQRRFLRHLFRVICRRDKPKFRYLMCLLAWFVQNPDKRAEVVLVLKSREQGTGKSTVGKVMLDIFGQHGILMGTFWRCRPDWRVAGCAIHRQLGGARIFRQKLAEAEVAATPDVLRRLRRIREEFNRSSRVRTPRGRVKGVAPGCSAARRCGPSRNH
jgi:hypothetical protein